MSKKKLLFVMPGLDAGGGEKSLINLLGQIDYTEYEVELFLFSPKGLFIEFLPAEVRLLPPPALYRAFILPWYRAVLQLLARGKLRLAGHRLLYSLVNRVSRNGSRGEQRGWRFLAGSLEEFQGSYDAVIGYLEKTSIYCCVDKVVAARKIGWIHTDYDKMGMDPRFDSAYFQRLDALVTVSQECASILKKRFPDMGGKIRVIHNIVSPAVIRQLAGQEEGDAFDREAEETILLSIGRLQQEKGFDLAIEACKLLREQGCPVRWFIIGEGSERQRLESLIGKHGLTEHVRLLGQRANPYPYIRQADIYVQPSRMEGKSIAIDEAKILHKPVVVTRFATARDQIEDEVDGLIVEMNPAALAAGIRRLIREPQLRKTLTDNLARMQLGTEAEIAKLYQLIL